MARRKRVYNKEVRKDSRYDSELVATLISNIMLDGKKSLAERIVYSAIEALNDKTDSVDPLELFNVEVKARRVGGATYQVPLEVSPRRQESLAMRWIVGFARGRKGQAMHRALANELKDAAQGQGNAVRKRDDVHKQAQANRAFAHFRF
ncbi:MAG: 30S ribosomal protein S7 [Verrucomicrobia bacterium 12-59-8]|nr:MAG: 30S ribosomal protein S7 [Verrucomicrobia bacterium 12-59-8]